MAIGHPPGLPRWHRYPGAPVSAFVENTGPAIAVQTPWRRGAVIGANDVCSAAKGRLGLAPFPSSTVLDSFLTSTDISNTPVRQVPIIGFGSDRWLANAIVITESCRSVA
jgi:hypothetical protein